MDAANRQTRRKAQERMKGWYTVQDLADTIGVSIGTVRRWAKRHQLSVVRFGYGIRISAAEFARVQREGITYEKEGENDG